MNKYIEFFKADRFAANAGVELLEVKPGYAKARMLVTPEHMNAGGVCQGGALFTLADLAFAAVANINPHFTFRGNMWVNLPWENVKKQDFKIIFGRKVLYV